MGKLEEKLNEVVAEGMLKSYKIIDVDENGVEGRQGDCRNSERLYLEFPNGKTIMLETFCSGSAENSCFCLYSGY